MPVDLNQMPELAVIPIGLIRPYWNNPRKISEEAVDKVRKSIEEFGFNQPIVLTRDNVIIVGHTRYKALLSMGATEVMAIVLDLSPEEITEYRIVDNKTNELTSWDIQKLFDEIRDIGPESVQGFFPDIDFSVALSDLNFTPDVRSLSGTGVDSDQNSNTAEGHLQHPGSATLPRSGLDDSINLTCPECAHEFFASRRQLLGIPF